MFTPAKSAGYANGCLRTVCIVAVCFLVSACSNIGPGSIARDRFDYAGAISDSWKKQMLLNLVRLRYADLPVFLEVSSVINQYNIEGEVNAGSAIGTQGAPDIFSFGGTGRFYDRPTISYVPLQGERFTRSILRPIPPAAVFALIQSGWPADFLFTLTVRAVNGVFSRSRIHAMRRDADPEWGPLISAIRRMQRSGVVGMRIEKKDGKDAAIAVLSSDRAKRKQIQDDREYIRKVLDLDPKATDFNLTYGLVPRNQAEIALLTRSMFEVMLELATGVNVPQIHESKGWVRVLNHKEKNERGLVQISSGQKKPKHSFAAVRYRGSWFWIDDADLRSKGTVTLLNFFLNLSETGGAQPAPVVTITAGSR